MHILRSLRSFSSFLVFTSLFAQSALAAFDSKAQWAWIDESCNDKLGVLDKATEEYLELAKIAYNSLGEGITESGKANLKTFFGKIDPTGLLIQSAYIF